MRKARKIVKEIALQAIEDIGGARKEYMYIWYFRGLEPLEAEYVMGDVDEVLTETEAIVATSRSIGADGVLLYHNHPNQVLFPSKADIKAAKEIKKELADEGIALLDCLVITEDGYVGEIWGQAYWVDIGLL